MGSVGLLYVGAVLFLNGVMLLEWIDAKSAAPLNVFVGILQVVTPTYLIFTADGDVNQILGASGLYLFGFTYLYVAFNLFFDLDGTGLGYFSGFVAACAVVYAGLNCWRDGFGDNGFGVIWLYWAFLWGLFFVLLGLRRDHLAHYVGAVTAIEGFGILSMASIGPILSVLSVGLWIDRKRIRKQVERRQREAEAES